MVVYGVHLGQLCRISHNENEGVRIMLSANCLILTDTVNLKTPSFAEIVRSNIYNFILCRLWNGQIRLILP